MAALLWDQHACLPLRLDADISELARFSRAGETFVSVNVGYAPQSLDDVLALVEQFRRPIHHHPALVLAETGNFAIGTITVAFDLEDCAPLEGDLANVARLAQLGIRTMLPTYNHANIAGCGCLDTMTQA